MGQRAAGLVGEEVGQLLEADLDVLGGVVVVGEVGRVAPCVLAGDEASQSAGHALEGRLTRARPRAECGVRGSGNPGKMLTSSWLYSFSKRCRRRAGSFAKSLRALEDDSGVCARRRDHCDPGAGDD
jgi:hypothetical protein